MSCTSSTFNALVFCATALAIAGGMLFAGAGAGAGAQDTVLISATPDGNAGNDLSDHIGVSSSGRFVTFASLADDLVDPVNGDPNGVRDFNGVADVFLRDRDPDGNEIFDEGNAITQIISVNSAEQQATVTTLGSSVTPSGRYVAFSAGSNDLQVGLLGGVFVRDRDPNGDGAFDAGEGITVPVGVNSDGDPVGGGAHIVDISDDGRFVVWSDNSMLLVPDDTNNVSDIFVHDRQVSAKGPFDVPGNIATVRVSISSSGTQANGLSTDPKISADGRHVAFWGFATNLVPGDTNLEADTFVHDRDVSNNGVFDEPGDIATTRVSVRSDGGEANGPSSNLGISGDGRFVAFFSSASNLVDGATAPNVYVRDRDPDENGVFDEGNGTTEVIGVGLCGDASSAFPGPAISTDGQRVAIGSSANDLVPGDTNGHADTFVYDRVTETSVIASVSSACDLGNDQSGGPIALSGDGRYVAFGSWATNLVPNVDENATSDVFVRDLSATCELDGICSDCAIVEPEQCDDGNTDDGDGCSSTCTVEPGWACVDEPSVCGPDCNGNGIPDEWDIVPSIAFSVAPQLLLNQITSFLISAAGTLAGPRIPLDVDNDNHTDLAVIASGDGDPDDPNALLIVFTGNGDPDGTFSLGIETPLGLNQPGFPTAGDCDNDGDVDLFVSDRIDFGSQGLYLMRNILHDGTFADPVTIGNADGFNGTAVADFDRDGFLDLAAVTQFVAGPLPRLQVFENLGDCTYAAPVPFAVGSPQGLVAVVDDFNNDSWPDVAISIQGQEGAVGVFLNTNTGPGPGVVDENLFGDPVEYEVGDSPRWVTTAHLDADSNVDIVVTNLGQDPDTPTPTVAILWNNEDDPGTFLPAQHLPSASALGQMTIADLDGDGDLDIVLGVRNYPPYILENLGNRNFAPAKNFGDTATGISASVGAGDYDEDGRADLAELFVDHVVILLNDYGPFSEDCNANGIPDECEVPPIGPPEGDCNENGTPDSCDIADGTSTDCNGNWVPDECEIDMNSPAPGEFFCDPADPPPQLGGCNPDCNDNGVPDKCEIPESSPDGLCIEDCDPDCNANGIPDQCDIAEMTSSDCNVNGIPDECELPASCKEGICTVGCDPDCNGNCIIDACDIDPLDPDGDGQVSDDCDGNDIPDECQLPESCDDGICTIDCDPDCNNNCTIDACDIADCPAGVLDCNDCNLNGIPDFCDDPTDSIPDECIEFDGECAEGDPAWTCPENWEGDIVPDNTEDLNFSVTLAGIEDDVFLDADITIDTLRVLADASLSVTQAGTGDFTVVEPGGILVQGNLLVANDRLIDATAGEVTIGSGGVYQADPDAMGAVSATLVAGDLTLLHGVDFQAGAVMTLTDSMVVTVEGDLRSSSIDDKGSETPPPELSVRDAGVLGVLGDMNIEGSGHVEHSSSEPLGLGGSFINSSTDPFTFDWGAGALTMSGASQTIEAAGEDRGPWPAGLVDNFAFGTLTVVSGAVVEVVDTFDNQQDGVVACDEALYVGTLEVGTGAVLTTDGCKLYYEVLINSGSIPALGVDVLQILEPIAQDFNGDGRVDSADLAELLSGWGACAALCGPPDCPADFDGNCDVNAADLAELLSKWGAVPE